MAKGFCPIDTFADVEKLYNNTKPVVVRTNTDCVTAIDIRPTNDRSRKWERVVKLSSNKYALVDSDALYFGYRLFNTDYFSYELLLKCIEVCAPIVWTRHKDGTETMQVRNINKYSVYTSYPTSRVDFLYRHLPNRWYVYSDQGRQYVRCPIGTFYLPKNTYLPRSIRKQSQRYKNMPIYFKHAQSKHDYKLVFVRDKDGSWSVKDTYRETRKYIDKERKAKLKPTINKFYDNAFPIMHMLIAGGNTHPFSTYTGDDDCLAFIGAIKPYVNSDISTYTLIGALKKGAGLNNKVRSVVKHIMANPEHEAFFGLVKLLISACYDFAVYNDTEVSKLRGKINKWLNSFFNLYVEKEI